MNKVNVTIQDLKMEIEATKKTQTEYLKHSLL